MILDKLKELDNPFKFYLGLGVNWLFSTEIHDKFNALLGTLGAFLGVIYSGFMLYVLIRDKIIKHNRNIKPH